MARDNSTDEFGRSRDDSRYRGENRGRYEDNHRREERRDDRRPEQPRYNDRSRDGGGDRPRNGDDNRDDRNGGDNRLEPGVVIQGKVSRIESYGAFIDFGRGQRGLVHISQLAPHRVEKVEDVVHLDRNVYAVILEVDQRRIRLSMRSVNQETGEENVNERRDDHRRGDQRGGGPQGQPNNGKWDHRARQRQQLLQTDVITWRDAPRERGSDLLWSRSPSPPAREKPPAKKDEEGESDGSESGSDSSSSSESSESSEEERRRRRKRRRAKGGDKRRRRRRRRSPSTSSSSSSDGSSKDESASEKKDKRDKKKTRHDDDDAHGEADERAERKEPASGEVMDKQDLKDAQDFKKAVQGKNDDSDDDDDDIGPMPLPQSNASENKSNSSYGGALLPGEGQALAAYVQQNLRIPRRGEIGYSGDDIESYEHQGYVMSGSRHARMNAVRIRKENQVYSAEEQRALALITMEENQQKESQLMQDFRTMLKEKQRVREQGK